MAATCNLMNAQNNKNSAAVVFDALTGNYVLTQPDTFVDPDTYYDIISFLENTDNLISLDQNTGELVTLEEKLEKYNVPAFSGKALFSSILPPDFYYRKGDVYIRDGVLINGVIDKTHIGSAHRSIIQIMYKQYGRDRTVDFLTDIYNIGGKFLNTHGFSVGMDDCFLTGKDSQKTIEREIQKAKILAKSMGRKLLDPLEEERRENQIMAYLNTGKGMGVKISRENLKPDNALNVMAKSGAKGSTHNIAQITGILGQQFLKGQRMPEVISGGNRSLPYFPEDSIDPAARGFVTNSFLTGLTPAEYFFAACGGREGLCNTAISTADTGKIHREMVKALEDIKVYDDGSVRNAYGVIFEFAYGEDGFDAGELIQVSTNSGGFSSFIDMKSVVGNINSKYGYATPGDPKPQFKELPAEKRQEKFVKQTEKNDDLPVLGITVSVGDKVKTDIGVGDVKEIDGNRILVGYRNEIDVETESWSDIDELKLEKK